MTNIKEKASKAKNSVRNSFSVIPSFTYWLLLFLPLAFCDHSHKDVDLHDVLIEQAEKADLFGSKGNE